MKPAQVTIGETTFEVEHYENDLFLNFDTLTLILSDGYQKFRDLAIEECGADDEDVIKEYMHTYMQQFVDENVSEFRIYND